MKNFRDKWVGSSEGNLEKIFRLIHALGRCYVFIDEADQALGRRDSASGDSGVGGRIYSMLAEEIGGSTNRGRVIWVLASSRPDLIEVDLKRPGRVDVKISAVPDNYTAGRIRPDPHALREAGPGDPRKRPSVPWNRASRHFCPPAPPKHSLSRSTARYEPAPRPWRMFWRRA